MEMELVRTTRVVLRRVVAETVISVRVVMSHVRVLIRILANLATVAVNARLRLLQTRHRVCVIRGMPVSSVSLDVLVLVQAMAVVTFSRHMMVIWRQRTRDVPAMQDTRVPLVPIHAQACVQTMEIANQT